jgi:hypothetical protein
MDEEEKIESEQHSFTAQSFLRMAGFSNVLSMEQKKIYSTPINR